MAAPASDRDARRVLVAFGLTASFMLAEVAGGVISGSLALLADAGHMLTDAASLALALFAFRLARRPADAARTYGWHRVQVLAAFVNALALLVIVAWIAWEAVARLLAPQPVGGGMMLGVAVVGLAVNVAAFAVLHGGDQQNVNLRGAALHVLGDLLGSVAAIVAALVILWTGWTPIDPILSLLVALLILRTTMPLLRRTAHILLEGTPEALDVASLRDHVATVDGVVEVHHVHAWMLTPDRNLVTLHARILPGTDDATVLHRIHHELRERFDVGHATVQIERDPECPAPPCRPGRGSGPDPATTSPHSRSH